MSAVPPYINVIPQISHVRTETEQERPLSAIQHQVVHYLAGPLISPVMTPAQELSLLQQLAVFHQHRDFGGGWLGRTLEYTYAIALSGRIYRVNRETLQTWSHKNGNRIGMSTVLLIGSGQTPSEAMLTTLRQHLDYTISRTDMRVARQRTWAHGETSQIYGGGPDWGNNTDCCGRAQPWVKQYREEEPMPQGPQNPDENGFFVATGHSFVLGGGIATYWQQNGGVAEFGYPLEQEQGGDQLPWSLLPELAGYTVQMFERKALAWMTGHDVAVVRLGAVIEAMLAHGHYASEPLSCSCEQAPA